MGFFFGLEVEDWDLQIKTQPMNAPKNVLTTEVLMIVFNGYEFNKTKYCITSCRTITLLPLW